MLQDYIHVLRTDLSHPQTCGSYWILFSLYFAFLDFIFVPWNSHLLKWLTVRMSNPFLCNPHPSSKPSHLCSVSVNRKAVTESSEFNNTCWSRMDHHLWDGIIHHLSFHLGCDTMNLVQFGLYFCLLDWQSFLSYLLQNAKMCYISLKHSIKVLNQTFYVGRYLPSLPFSSLNLKLLWTQLCPLSFCDCTTWLYLDLTSQKKLIKFKLLHYNESSSNMTGELETEWGPWEHTERRQLSASHRESGAGAGGGSEEISLPESWSWVSSPQTCETIHFCCLTPVVRDSLLWKPWQSKTGWQLHCIGAGGYPPQSPHTYS